MDDFLFVYGSLKTGFCNHDMLHGNGYLVCEAKTHPFYRMYGCGNFPALVKDDNGTVIVGELWNVKKSIFTILDEFEGVDIGLYHREIILLAQPCVLAHTYLFCRAVKNLPDCGPVWKGKYNDPVQASE